MFGPNAHQKSSFYFAGAASLFDLAGNLSGKVKIGDMSDDVKALRGDWVAVGNDIGEAKKSVMRSLSSTPKETHARKGSTR